MLSPLSHRLSLNWTADHFPLCVFGACFLFGFGFVCSVALGVVFLFAAFLQWNRDGCWTMYRSHTSSLLWPPTNGGYLYALIS